MSVVDKNKVNCLFKIYILLFEMPKYAVAKGRQIGVYDTWAECKKHVEGFTGAKYKKFDTQKQAEDFISGINGTSPVKSNNSISRITSFENMSSEEAFPIPRISPSDTAMTDLKKSICLLETKLSAFMKHVNTSFDDIKNRLSALEERKIIGDQIMQLEAEEKEITGNASKRKGVKRKATNLDLNDDLQDEDFINLNYDDNNKNDDEKATTAQSANSDKPLPKPKDTKLPKCKIIDEADGYYGINQCVVNSRGFLVNPFGAVVVYTDGACTKNGQAGAKAGIGVWFNHNHPCNVSQPVRGRATNNNAEIQAATAAVLQAAGAGIRHLHIYTDSQFLINCITTWIYKWKQNNWKTVEGKPVINKVELVELDNCINEYMDSVVWTYVKGHSGDIGNSAADELARKGALGYSTEGDNVQ